MRACGAQDFREISIGLQRNILREKVFSRTDDLNALDATSIQRLNARTVRRILTPRSAIPTEKGITMIQCVDVLRGCNV